MGDLSINAVANLSVAQSLTTDRRLQDPSGTTKAADEVNQSIGVNDFTKALQIVQPVGETPPRPRVNPDPMIGSWFDARV